MGIRDLWPAVISLCFAEAAEPMLTSLVHECAHRRGRRFPPGTPPKADQPEEPERDAFLPARGLGDAGTRSLTSVRTISLRKCAGKAGGREARTRPSGCLKRLTRRFKGSAASSRSPAAASINAPGNTSSWVCGLGARSGRERRAERRRRSQGRRLHFFLDVLAVARAVFPASWILLRRATPGGSSRCSAIEAQRTGSRYRSARIRSFSRSSVPSAGSVAGLTRAGTASR